MYYAIFLERSLVETIPPHLVKEHVEGLKCLERAGRLVACGPFSDGGGGLVLASFDSKEDADKYAASDPFVREGFSVGRVREWEWSHIGNCHLGVMESEPFLKALRNRATIRNFLDRPIPKSTIKELLTLALSAPSEFNLQPWRPIVCYSKETKTLLKNCCFGQEHAEKASASVIIAVSTKALCDDVPRAVDGFISTGRWPKEKREEYISEIRSYYEKGDPIALRLHAVKNGMIFGHQLLLASLAIGLGGFWMGGIDEEKAKKAFDIPKEVVIAGVVGLGWPEKEMPQQPKLSIDTIVSWEKWEIKK